MARVFLSPLNLNKNEIRNAVAQVLAAAPASPVPGQFYYNSTTGRFEYRGATAWIDPTARANHTGTQLAATISNFDTQVRTSTLNQMAAPTAALSLNSQRITNLAEPTAATDAATKNYVDNKLNGTDWKESVRVATLTDIALSGLLTVDGITLVAGDRVLVKNQTTGSQNGIYVAATGAWTRSTDADANPEVTAGMAVMVTEGTTQGSTQWTLSTSGAITVGTTALTFTQIGAAIAYQAGTGTNISGNTVQIDTSVVVRKFNATIGDGTATTFTVAHGLGSMDVQVQVYELATGETVECDVARTSTSQITLAFSVAPTAGQFRVLVQG